MLDAVMRTPLFAARTREHVLLSHDYSTDLDLFVARRSSVTHKPTECTVATRLARAQAVRRLLTAIVGERTEQVSSVEALWAHSNTATQPKRESLLIYDHFAQRQGAVTT